MITTNIIDEEEGSLKFDDGESVSSLIPHAYDFFTKHNASINPSLDDRMGTVGISL